jgi:hypothetical protein
MKYTEHSVKASTEKLEEALSRLNAMDVENKRLKEELWTLRK